VERDRSGAVTGIFIEMAASLLLRAIPRRREPSEDLARAIRRAHSLGITGAHDFDRSDIWRAAQELSARDKLPFRLLLSVPAAKLEATHRDFQTWTDANPDPSTWDTEYQARVKGTLDQINEGFAALARGEGIRTVVEID